MNSITVSDRMPAMLMLPPRVDMDDIATLCARMQRLRCGLEQYSVVSVRLHVITDDGNAALVIDDDGRTLWNASGEGFALQAWRRGSDEYIKRVMDACAIRDDASPHLDIDADHAQTRGYACLPGGCRLVDGQRHAVLELRLSSDSAPPFVCDVARALWAMQQSENEPLVSRGAVSMYRAQALSAIDGAEATEQLPLLRPMIGRRTLWIAVFVLLLLPLAMLLPMPSSVSGRGMVMIANAPVQQLERDGRVIAHAVTLNQRVRNGQVLFWFEDPQAHHTAEAAYRHFAAAVRERLLDPQMAERSILPSRLADLRVASDARRIPVVATTAGVVRELPRIGEVFERGARIGFVMPDRPRFELDARIDALYADVLQVGDSGRARTADGREWPVRVTHLDARAASGNTGGHANGNGGVMLGVRAELLRADDVLPDMPVNVQFDGRRMPIYRQLLKRWGRSG